MKIFEKISTKIREQKEKLFGRNGWSSKKFMGVYLLKFAAILAAGAFIAYCLKPQLEMISLLMPSGSLIVPGLGCLGIDAYNKKVKETSNQNNK